MVLGIIFGTLNPFGEDSESMLANLELLKTALEGTFLNTPLLCCSNEVTFGEAPGEYESKLL